MDWETQLRTMRDGLKLSPEQVDSSKLAPVLVPKTFFDVENWPGPYTRLRTKDVGLTWVLLLPNQTMRYVGHDIAHHWEAKGLDWKELAVRNLAEHSPGNLGTHEFRRADGKIYAVAMMHADGIGPSRVLLRDQLLRLFPEGYRVALPEMSCAFAFSSDVEESEINKIQGLIDDCYRKGTRPLAPGIYTPEDLLPNTKST